MNLYNPYTRKSVNYPLDLSNKNIVRKYYMTHETFFCQWHTTWQVLHLQSGDVIYLPYGDRNRRDIYIVTPHYLNKTVRFPYGVYTLKYYEFLKTSTLNIPNNTYDDEEDDWFDDEDDDYAAYLNSLK